jgi:hypothetical protein
MADEPGNTQVAGSEASRHSLLKIILHVPGKAQRILALANQAVTKYFPSVKNRFLLLKQIAIGAFCFPTPFFIYFFIAGVDPFDLNYTNRFLLMSTLLLSGAILGLASYYKDSAVAALKDWYPSDKTQRP